MSGVFLGYSDRAFTFAPPMSSCLVTQAVWLWTDVHEPESPNTSTLVSTASNPFSPLPGGPPARPSVQVDNNVTRHLDSTLKRDDWDVLILHYLGLDHIGHVSGPRSPLVRPKLLEMDDVLKKIHGALVSKVNPPPPSPSPPPATRRSSSTETHLNE